MYDLNVFSMIFDMGGMQEKATKLANKYPKRYIKVIRNNRKRNR